MQQEKKFEKKEGEQKFEKKDEPKEFKEKFEKKGEKRLEPAESEELGGGKFKEHQKGPGPGEGHL